MVVVSAEETKLMCSIADVKILCDMLMIWKGEFLTIIYSNDVVKQNKQALYRLMFFIAIKNVNIEVVY